jgi:hypothetical protein
MDTVLGSILREGALVQILVGLARAETLILRQQGKPIPNPMSLQALIDPGAEQTCLSPEALAPLIGMGIQPTKFVFANMPATVGFTSATQYNVGLSVVHPSQNSKKNLILRTCPVLEQPLGPLGYQALLGRDVLSNCLLIYDGPSARFTLGY